MIARGRDNARTSFDVASTYVRSLYRKLQVDSVAAAIMRVLRERQ